MALVVLGARLWSVVVDVGSAGGTQWTVVVRGGSVVGTVVLYIFCMYKFHR